MSLALVVINANEIHQMRCTLHVRVDENAKKEKRKKKKKESMHQNQHYSNCLFPLVWQVDIKGNASRNIQRYYNCISIYLLLFNICCNKLRMHEKERFTLHAWHDHEDNNIHLSI